MTDDELFVHAGLTRRGAKVQCTICHRTGYPDALWQNSCRAGHPYLCSCGRRFSTKSGIAAHRRTWPPEVHADMSAV